MSGHFNTGYDKGGWSYTRGLKTYIEKMVIERAKAGLNGLFEPILQRMENNELDEIAKNRALYALGDAAGFGVSEVDEILDTMRSQTVKALAKDKPCYSKRKKLIEKSLSEPSSISALKGRILVRKYKETKS